MSNKEERGKISQAIRLGICVYQHLGFDSPKFYKNIAIKVIETFEQLGYRKPPKDKPPHIETQADRNDEIDRLAYYERSRSPK